MRGVNEACPGALTNSSTQLMSGQALCPVPVIWRRYIAEFKKQTGVLKRTRLYLLLQGPRNSMEPKHLRSTVQFIKCFLTY